MAAVVILDTSIAEAQSKEILLPLTFNEVAKGDVPAILRGEDVFLKATDLERFGVTGTMWTRMVAFSRLISGSRCRIGDPEFFLLRALPPDFFFTIDRSRISLSAAT